jgi:hypothetical protein
MSFERDAAHPLLSLYGASDGKIINYGASEAPLCLPLQADLYQHHNQNQINWRTQTNPLALCQASFSATPWIDSTPASENYFLQP